MNSKNILLLQNCIIFPAIEPIVLVIVNDVGIYARKIKKNFTFALAFQHVSCIQNDLN